MVVRQQTWLMVVILPICTGGISTRWVRRWVRKDCVAVSGVSVSVATVVSHDVTRRDQGQECLLRSVALLSLVWAMAWSWWWVASAGRTHAGKVWLNVRGILWVCGVVPIANSGPGAPLLCTALPACDDVCVGTGKKRGWLRRTDQSGVICQPDRAKGRGRHRLLGVNADAGVGGACMNGRWRRAGQPDCRLRH